MAHIVVMPKLGNTVESSIIVKWNVAEGQSVSQDDVLCEIETDKATMDVPAGTGGVLLKRLRAEGDDVLVLEPIAVIGEPGERYEGVERLAADAGKAMAIGAAGDSIAAAAGTGDGEISAGVRKAAEPANSEAAPGDMPAGTAIDSLAAVPGGISAGRKAASPRAKKRAQEQMVSLDTISGSGPHGRILERDVNAFLKDMPGFSSAAREAMNRSLGKEAFAHGASSGLGTAIRGEAGTGLGGRLLVKDVAQLSEKAHASIENSASHTDFTDEPIKGIRKIIADRMLHSLQASAQLTLHASAQADSLLSLRARFKQSAPELGLSGVTIGDMVAFAVSRVLLKHPLLNAHALPGVIRKFKHVHLGLAVDTPRGLMVPVIRNADTLSLKEISAQAKQLAKACIEGTISPDALSGSTFTLTNLGAFGIERFTPILNEPETAIMGLCSIVPRPKTNGNGNEMRIGLSLTHDHRIVDGADGARFLKDLSAVLAEFDIYLLADGLKN